jgi:vacuolar protein 8
MALANFALDKPAICAAIEAAGGIPALKECLRRSRSERVQEEAAWALANLSPRSPDRCAAIAADRGISLLVQRLRLASVGVQDAVSGALINLAAGSTERQAAIAAEGAIPLLVRSLQSNSEDLRTKTAAVLESMTLLGQASSPDHCAAIVAAGGIPALRQYQGSWGSSPNGQQAAANALGNIHVHTTEQQLEQQGSSQRLHQARQGLLTLLLPGCALRRGAATQSICAFVTGKLPFPIDSRCIGIVRRIWDSHCIRVNQ